ncbi:amino acid adenylation domain-containing protein [Pseudomonas viridiflava]|uniref:non-ribosomal peptide synthetase n=1 Tax=Pseudomonas viridiflava TaxID=33069 RepID=UPI002EB47BC6|nr:amino acid adenylation domain-containing protein [Pseudomonas viridiflava]
MKQLADAWPISEEQKGLWYLHQVNPGLGAYNLLFSCTVRKVRGTWPNTRFLQDMIREYPVLRSAFVVSTDGVEQRVFSDLQARVLSTDASHLDEQALRALAREDSRTPFDLNEPGLWRVHLYHMAHDRCLVVLVMHHIAFDFWSVGLLLKEAMARAQGSPSLLHPDEANGYDLYARLTPSAQRLAELTAYWTRHLHNAPSLHTLPLDRPRPGKQQFQGASVAFKFSTSTSEGIRTAAKQLHATPYMVMLTIYAIFLSHWSASDEVVISTPVANRAARRLRNTLGQFVNTLCLRVTTSTSASFAQVLSQVKDTVTGAIRHQDMPFYRLVESLAPKRDNSYNAIAQLGFSWEKLPVLADFAGFYNHGESDEALLGDNLQLGGFHVPQQEGQLDLMLEMGGEVGGAYEAIFKYDPQLFEASTIQRMSDALAKLATRLIAHTELPLEQLLPGDSVQQTQWASLGEGAPLELKGRSVLKQIAEHVRTHPNSSAVADAYSAYTYQQLWQYSERMAQTLQASGVRPGDRVGFKLERSAEMVMVILGIWRIGASYVPLDPHFPSDRLAYIADDAQLRLVVTTVELDDFPASLERLYIGTFDTHVTSPLASPTVGDDTAYILYTSGSTGNPKGVEIGHHALTNFMLSMQASLGFDAGTRMLAVTTPSFDISVLELFLPLVAGGHVQVADYESTRDGGLLSGLIDQHSINAMQATPATWHMLLERAEPNALKALMVLCGGDVFPQPLADRLLLQASSVWNLYGPTETTIWSSLTELQYGVPLSLGRPIANTDFLVLDEHQRLLPPGMLGELWIAGAGLAKGYWQRSELTREQFRDDLGFGGKRWYRTGDQVRWNSRGELEHHGRLDFQVKLRGFRIELEEVQACLVAIDGIDQAVAAVVENERGSMLVAYLVVCPDAQPAVASIKSRLKTKLPAYMVPSDFVFLEKFPLTPNNKIDRKRLPAPSRPPERLDVIAPRDELERQLMLIFQAVLRTDTVCIHDDFFDVGGHSLLAVELVGRVQKDLELTLKVGELLDNPSIASLAERLRRGESLYRGNLITLRKGHGRPVWLFHPIGGNVISYRELSRHLAGTRPVLAVQSPGLENTDDVEVTIEAMASRYLLEMREVQPTGPYLVGGWCFGGAIAYEVARQLQEESETLEGIFLVDTRAPIAENVPDDADDSTLLSWFARDLATPHGMQWNIEPAVLRAKQGSQAFAYVLAEAKKLGVLSEQADDAQLARYFETYLANGIALQLYFPSPTTLPMLLMLARDEIADYGQLLGWDTLANGGLTAVELAGDHNSIMYAPQVMAVAEQINTHFLTVSVLEPQS